MPKEKYKVELRSEEIGMLHEITHNGKNSAKTIMHANVLLLTNDVSPNKKTDRELAELFGLSKTTISEIRKTYATYGLQSALHRKTCITPPILSKITGDFEAHVIATALSPAPDGRARWTLRLLAERCVEKHYIVAISHSSIGHMLNTNQVKPHLGEYWCIPKENDAGFVANMEDILGIYQRTYDPMIPVVCMDEKPIQFLAETRSRIQAKPLRIDTDTQIPKPGKAERIDSEYIRCGHGSIFIFTEPLAGWRYAVTRRTRKKSDFAQLVRQILDTRYAYAEKVLLVLDNLNTHCKAAFYEAFPAPDAYRITQRLEFHYTPVHGSWLNIAECELSALARECLGNRRISCIDELNAELYSWQTDRKFRQKGVNWQFTTENARIKLKRLYPTPLF
jgi:hypothetical protein